MRSNDEAVHMPEAHVCVCGSFGVIGIHGCRHRFDLNSQLGPHGT